MSDYPLTSTWAEVDAAAQAVKNGLPKANLSGAVQASLDKADGAVQVGDQATKTSSMTQAVGVDLQGKLWVDSSTSVVCEISLDDDEYVCDTSFSDLADALAAHSVIECKTPEGLAFCQGFKGTNYYLITFTVQSASGSSLSLVQYQYAEDGTIERKVFTTGGGGGGDAELFWITITAFGGSFVMDCTWADIADAMSNGMLIVAKSGDRRYWWNGDPTDDGLQLVSVDVSSSSKAYAQAFTISDNGTISRKSNVSLNPSDLWLNTLSLSSSEKEKARGNIGAGTYSIPSGGIPSTDMSSAVQTSLGKADNAYQKPPGGIPLTDLAESVETPATVVQVSGNTPTIDAPAGNTIYKCTGDVTQLTVQNYGYTEFVLKFNTSLTTDPTVTIDSRIWLPDGFTFEKNRHYEMNVDSNGFALIADWVYVD